MTTTSSATARGDLGEAMLPVAAHLAAIVHGDGGPEDIREALDGLDEAQRTALIVVLAGLVDPDQPMGRVLGWLDFDEHGEPVVPDWDDTSTLRQLADDQWQAEGPDVDRVAVDRYLRGQPVALNRQEQVEAILEGLRRGMGYHDLDALAHARRGTSYGFIRRERQAALARGETFPEVMPAAKARLTVEQVVAIRERSAAGATDLEIAMSVGLTRKNVSAIVAGDSYRDAGGPLREKRRVRRPSEATRVLWMQKADVVPGRAAA